MNKQILVAESSLTMAGCYFRSTFYNLLPKTRTQTLDDVILEGTLLEMISENCFEIDCQNQLDVFAFSKKKMEARSRRDRVAWSLVCENIRSGLCSPVRWFLKHEVFLFYLTFFFAIRLFKKTGIDRGSILIEKTNIKIKHRKIWSTIFIVLISNGQLLSLQIFHNKIIYPLIFYPYILYYLYCTLLPNLLSNGYLSFQRSLVFVFMKMNFSDEVILNILTLFELSIKFWFIIFLLFFTIRYIFKMVKKHKKESKRFLNKQKK